MSGEKEKHYKYTVIKNDDVERYLSVEGRRLLNRLLNTLNMGRANEGKSSHDYLVVGTHEPYAGEVEEIMRKNGVVPFTK